MRIILRADGNSQMGLGHVMRLLALAEMLQPDFFLNFAIQSPTPAIKNLISGRDLEIITLPTEKDFDREANWLKENILRPHDVLVLDGYHFKTTYQELLRPHLAALFCLDDLHAFPFAADVIINPAGGVTADQYALGPGTQLFTGPDYALLRGPFLAFASRPRSVKKISRIFINFGGADPQNHTLRVLQEIEKLGKPVYQEVVVGSAYSFLEELNNYIKKGNLKTVTVHQNLTAEAMGSLMQLCEAAICPPSTVAYEWCCIKGPLFLIRTADNQVDLEKFLLQEKLAFPFTQFSEMINNINFPEIITAQAKTQQKYFHGQSRLKWRELFFKKIYPLWLSLRPAKPSDRDILFNWINEPAVRQYSLNPAPVPLDIHISWFRKKIQEENSFIFIAELGKEPVGMIRFDLSGPEALISYLLDKNYRGKGLGTALLEKGIAEFIKVAGEKAEKITGLVQKQNIASVKAFEKAGFFQEVYCDSQHPNLIKFSLSLRSTGAA